MRRRKIRFWHIGLVIAAGMFSIPVIASVDLRWCFFLLPFVIVLASVPGFAIKRFAEGRLAGSRTVLYVLGWSLLVLGSILTFVVVQSMLATAISRAFEPFYGPNGSLARFHKSCQTRHMESK